MFKFTSTRFIFQFVFNNSYQTSSQFVSLTFKSETNGTKQSP